MGDAEKQVGASTGDRPDRLSPLIASGGIESLFQPIVNLSLASISGREVLSRPAKTSGYAHAGELFDDAENQGRLWDLECLTRRVAFESALDWPSDTQLFMNATPQVLADPRFATELLHSVRSTPGLMPGRIVIELTERSENEYAGGLEKQVELLKSFGFEIAIDDVGAGTSGLNRIMALRPQWLKLDRELVENIHLDRSRQNLIRFFLHFARMSGVKMIAEGIEKPEELAALLDLGVVYAQGYFLGRPGSKSATLPESLVAFLAARRVHADETRVRDPRLTPVSRFGRTPSCVDAARTVADVASDLLRDASVLGVVLLDGLRFVGWCGRDHVLRGASDARSNFPISLLVHSRSVFVDAQTPLPDALEMAAARDDRSAADPLVLSEDGRVTAIATVADLMHAAAALSRDVQTRIAPVTGLPSRVRADEQIHELIRRSRETRGAAPTQKPPDFDAAVLDLRNFAQFNSLFGFDLGDQLLQRLAGRIKTELASLPGEIFIAHLGNDRFLVTASAGSLQEPLKRIAIAFDGETMRLGDHSGAFPSSAGSLVASLRIALMPSVFSHSASPRDVYRLADTARENDPPARHRSSTIIVLHPSQLTPMKLSA